MLDHYTPLEERSLFGRAPDGTFLVPDYLVAPPGNASIFPIGRTKMEGRSLRLAVADAQVQARSSIDIKNWKTRTRASRAKASLRSALPPIQLENNNPPGGGFHWSGRLD